MTYSGENPSYIIGIHGLPSLDEKEMSRVFSTSDLSIQALLWVLGVNRFIQDFSHLAEQDDVKNKKGRGDMVK